MAKQLLLPLGGEGGCFNGFIKVSRLGMKTQPSCQASVGSQHRTVSSETEVNEAAKQKSDNILHDFGWKIPYTHYYKASFSHIGGEYCVRGVMW